MAAAQKPSRDKYLSSVRKSLFVQLADSYVGLVLQIISAAIIARLLSPTEIGIFAVAAVLFSMASQFRDFGLGEYLIQEKELTNKKIRAAFAGNVIVSWTMATLLVSASWRVGDFYRQPGVGEIMRLQAVNFLIVPFGAVTMAYFRRELAYKPIFIASLAANLVSFAVAVGSAFSGLSYMSMAWSSLAGLVVTVAVSMWFRPAGFPRWPALQGLLEVIHFSKHAMGIYFFGQIGRSAPEAVIGKALDMASVAFFSRANGLMEIFNRTVLRAALPICLPYFAKSARAGESTVPGYLQATQLLTGAGWPFFFVIGILSFSTIRLLYGQQWADAVGLAQILCLVAAIELPYWLAKEVIIAVGRIGQANRMQFWVQGLRLLSLTLVFPFGLLGVCWGLVGSALVGCCVAHRFLRQAIEIHVIDILRACAPSGLVAAATALLPMLAAILIPQTELNYVAFLVFGGAASAIMWLLSLWAVKHAFWIEIRNIVASIATRWRARQPTSR